MFTIIVQCLFKLVHTYDAPIKGFCLMQLKHTIRLKLCHYGTRLRGGIDRHLYFITYIQYACMRVCHPKAINHILTWNKGSN